MKDLIRKHLNHLVVLSLLLASTATMAEDPPPEAPPKAKIVYHGFDPDIVTNYVNSGQKSLGYVRISLELMIKDEPLLEIVEHHEPMILNAIVDIIGKEDEKTVKSLSGREEIRQKIVKRIKDILKKETGDEIIKDVLFTKFLYQ